MQPGRDLWTSTFAQIFYKHINILAGNWQISSYSQCAEIDVKLQINI